MILRDQILAFLREHPSSTARIIADALGAPSGSVYACLFRMFGSHAVGRSRKMPFAYSLLDPFVAGVLASRAALSLESGTRLADEQRILSVLAEDRTQDHETLLGLLEWNPKRLAQAVDRLHSAGLVKTTYGSYVLILRSP